MNLNGIQDKIIEEFEQIVEGLKTKMNYFRHIAGYGKDSAAAHEVKRTDDNLVKQTKSKIWMEARYVDGKIYYTGDSDNEVVKGIVSLFVNVFSGRTAREIINANVYFLNEIKLYSRLSADRVQELLSVLQHMRISAVDLKLKNRELGFA